MTYIIENANILKDQLITKASLLIDNGKIASIKPDFRKYRFMRMNAAPFIMTPTPTLLQKEFPFDLSFQELKDFFIQTFFLKGCTTFLTLANVKHEYMLLNEIKRLKVRLLNCPIDYIIGVKIPVRLLTPTFLRKCKRERIPAIFVEINEMDELDDLPWGWIREAMFPYNSPLIPIFMNSKERAKIKMKMEWERKMESEKIPFIHDELLDNELIPASVLAKTGIYPRKSSINQGSELSYNLYLNSSEIRNIEVNELFHYHRNKLVVTVLRGVVIRAQDKVEFHPGSGEHVKINTPSYYTSWQG